MNAERPLTGAVFLVLVGIGLGIGFNVLHPKPLPWKAEPKKTVTLDTALGDPLESPEASPVDRAEAEQPMHGATAPPEKGEPGGESGSSPAEEPAVETAANPPAGQSEAETSTTPAATSKPGAGDLYSDIPESDYPINVDLAQAKKFYDRGGLLVLDAREHEDFAAGHLAGANSAYADEMMGDIEWLDKTAKDPRPILVYCDGGDCELSLNLGFELTQSGHRRVLVFTDGYPAWKDAGYPTATGDMP